MKNHETTQQSDTTPAAKKRSRKHLWIAGIISGVCGALVTLAIVLAWYHHFLQINEFRFYPGVHIGSVDVSGLTYLDALDRVTESTEEIEENGIIVQYDGAEEAMVRITPTVVPLDSADTERELFHIDSENSIKAAYAIGRTGNWFEQLKEQWWAGRYSRNVQLNYAVHREDITSLLRDTFGSYETPAVNADIVIDADGDITITDQVAGEILDYETITDAVEAHIRSIDTTTIHIEMQPDQPTVTTADIEQDADTVARYLAEAPVTLTWEGKSWEFSKADLGSWLSYSSGTLRVSPTALDKSLDDAHELIDVDVKESRWAVDKNEGGALTGIHETQAAVTGKTIDTEQTAQDILTALQKNTAAPSIELAVTTVTPKVTPDNVNDLGIKDLLGTGHSNMTGSPGNRKLNIARGAELLNGLLIAPGEDFSLLNALKPFTTDNGYYPELVIKGDKTTPEIGGGLCQIGTTTFRGAMNSGLPILKRQNHSYAVSYYSDDRNHQPGTDATIYDPAPDFSFENDTAGYILLQTHIEGNDLYFDFWGVSDGRKGSFTPPVTSNWIQPPALKEIPTTDLAVGARKCTESAHAGVTADFTYSVSFPDGTKKEQAFHSVYKPWQAVCLVGVAPDDPRLQSSQQQ